MAQPLVGNPQGHCFGHQPAGQGGLFDLLRADPIARAFDHRIAPSGEIEQAIGLAPDPVARPYRHAAIARGGGRWFEPLGATRRVLPIALRDQRPAMDQLAFRAVSGHCALIVDHQNFGVRNGFAHRGGVAVNQHGVKIG